MADLRAGLERLLAAIEEQIGSELDLRVDPYWNVPTAAAYNLDEPPTLDMGSVTDDVQSVSHYASRPGAERTSVWHECQHVAGVLRAIAALDLA